MKLYTVKDIAEMLSVNEETVRRWIRDGKLDAERGNTRQGSKVVDEALKNFLDQNKGLITSDAIKALGIGSVGVAVGTAVGASMASVAGVAAITGARLFGNGLKKKLNSKEQDKKIIKLELMEQEFELEKKKAQISIEIARLKSEASLIDSQIEKLKSMLKEIDRED